MSIRQTAKKAKIAVCEETTKAASLQVMDQRLKVFKNIMQVRKELGMPFEMSELPEDIRNFLFDSKNQL